MRHYATCPECGATDCDPTDDPCEVGLVRHPAMVRHGEHVPEWHEDVLEQRMHCHECGAIYVETWRYSHDDPTVISPGRAGYPDDVYLADARERARDMGRELRK